MTQKMNLARAQSSADAALKCATDEEDVDSETEFGPRPSIRGYGREIRYQRGAMLTQKTNLYNCGPLHKFTNEFVQRTYKFSIEFVCALVPLGGAFVGLWAGFP